jgi:uncharacterized membrane protein YdjX (TVP38/TMEM64 family)
VVRTHARLLLVVAAIAAVFLSAYVVVEALGVTVLEDPRPQLAGGGVAPAVVGVALLIADALLPVPSSLVMISLGALYGPALGALLSFAGRLGMTLAGVAIGRAGAPVFAKLIGAARRAHARDLVTRWGALALVVSRPVPILAETTALSVGAARLPWRLVVPAAVVGSVPEAVAYGVVGATAASARNGALVWLGFLVGGTLFRLAELVYRRRSQNTSAARATRISTAGT